jgi:hypothetical protein
VSECWIAENHCRRENPLGNSFERVIARFPLCCAGTMRLTLDPFRPSLISVAGCLSHDPAAAWIAVPCGGCRPSFLHRAGLTQAEVNSNSELSKRSHRGAKRKPVLFEFLDQLHADRGSHNTTRVWNGGGLRAPGDFHAVTNFASESLSPGEVGFAAAKWNSLEESQNSQIVGLRLAGCGKTAPKSSF